MLSILNKTVFPDYRNININMMPFISEDPKSLPVEFRHYWSMINQCTTHSEISYLTVRESYVPEGQTQSRPGVHTEGYNDLRWGHIGGGAWGGSKGVYLATNISNSLRIYDMKVEPGHLGDCSHLEMFNPYDVQANELVVISDRTPHEAIALNTPVRRQFFRLVTGEVSVWFSKHNTPNRLGIMPACPIVDYDKFTHRL